MFPPLSLLCLPIGSFISKCFPLVVGFYPPSPTFPLIIESMDLQKALLWFGFESLSFSASARAQASFPFDSSWTFVFSNDTNTM